MPSDLAYNQKTVAEKDLAMKWANSALGADFLDSNRNKEIQYTVKLNGIEEAQTKALKLEEALKKTFSKETIENFTFTNVLSESRTLIENYGELQKVLEQMQVSLGQNGN
jgi:hypothetical protein